AQRIARGCFGNRRVPGVRLLPLHDRAVAGRRRRIDEHVLNAQGATTNHKYNAREEEGAGKTMTKTTPNGGMNRRDLIKTTAAFAGAAALGGPLSARGAGAEAKTLDMWWWGQQELPGLQAFVDESVKNYTAATVKPMLQDTAVVISQFQTAAAA